MCLPAAQALVGGDHHPAARVDDAVAQRLGAEAAEDDGVHGADARAGEHRVDELGHHAHVDADAVAPADAVRQQHVRDAADVVLQLAVRDVAVGAELVLRPDDRGAVAERRQVAVDAVERGVEAAAREPGEVDLVVVGVEHVLPRVEPADRLRLLGPEPLGVVEREAVQPLVLRHRVDVGARGHFGLDGIEIGHLRLLGLLSGASDSSSGPQPAGDPDGAVHRGARARRRRRRRAPTAAPCPPAAPARARATGSNRQPRIESTSRSARCIRPPEPDTPTVSPRACA